MEDRIKERINALKRIMTVVRKEGIKQLLETSNKHQIRSLESMVFLGNVDGVIEWIKNHPNRDVQLCKKNDLRKTCSQSGIVGYYNMTVAEMRKAILADRTRIRDGYVHARQAMDHPERLEAISFLIEQFNLFSEQFLKYNLDVSRITKHAVEVHRYLLELMTVCNEYRNLRKSRTDVYWDMCSETDDEVIALEDRMRCVKRKIRIISIPKGLIRRVNERFKKKEGDKRDTDIDVQDDSQLVSN